MTISLPAGLTAETRTRNGWSRARGLSRSCGDAARWKDGMVIELQAFARSDLDPASDTGSPGTRKVPGLGAMAADVHGKKRQVDCRQKNSRGEKVQELRMMVGRIISNRTRSGSAISAARTSTPMQGCLRSSRPQRIHTNHGRRTGALIADPGMAALQTWKPARPGTCRPPSPPVGSRPGDRCFGPDGG